MARPSDVANLHNLPLMRYGITPQHFYAEDCQPAGVVKVDLIFYYRRGAKCASLQTSPHAALGGEQKLSVGRSGPDGADSRNSLCAGVWLR
jgi:hypothetical protein